MATTRSFIVVLGVIALLVLSGCAQLLPPGWNVTTSQSPTGGVAAEIEQTEEDLTVLDEAEEAGEDMEMVEEEPEEAPAETIETTTTPSADEGLPRKTVTEGELVSFPNLQATDPDGDPITYTFTPPLDADGKWQTGVGNAGEYRVTITASDGKNSVNQLVIIEVMGKNQPPRITLASKEIKVKEGESVTIDAKATDPDGDKVVVSFDGWMTSHFRTTGFDDAGMHEVEIIASDGTHTAKEMVKVIVQNINRAPTISQIADVLIKEGDKITVNPTASDPDGDRVTFQYGAPISPDGIWQTTTQDVGKYRINVTASDSQDTAVTSFLLTVESLNHAPVIQIADLVTVDEGKTVTLSPQITDPEGDELTISYSGWMNTNTYTTNYEDSGSHLVTITVSDGINSVKKDVTVMVNDVNRAPTFGQGAFS